jgi:hypothetical protein
MKYTGKVMGIDKICFPAHRQSHPAFNNSIDNDIGFIPVRKQLKLLISQEQIYVFSKKHKSF